MDTYTLLRQFADSWMLLVMTLLFVGIVAFALRPGSRALHREIANIPLRNDDAPMPADGAAPSVKKGN
ncbi:CcoQ/FixQ family Cbb3-type cytochrome c oxidase assembly chaperone [Oceanicella actignis]|uniref:Cytochrome c oxidase cbb3-type subunit 4 n=1 Tax=Oceanicella actignis TaxID=1189325 RepID=A0A1M7TJR8_9RHOB|nr:CcoQ/FixQ family Cbb3-type cytochrome c oxidase assembly chaperone [Oceanicella actignis]TYO88189.1 cytochrome c oxidase cbb3-type subunit 4 [Oceanicella actignis]SET67017.1 cytochrome c oxidase cbb3-type subunit 4 [Oceanicella actignis]SHN70960.1 cytochrome c oxidase cbb3-type subunit 4 [Oceanicella actignis]